MIGDAQQLSPVVKEHERPFMEKVYPSPYFFYSKALQKLNYVTIELQKVYRQKDAEFLELLNAVRENRVTQSVLNALNSRVNAYEDDGQTIRLTTHNVQSDSVNNRKLEELPGKPHMFEADIEGDFPENMYPADYALSLKEGAQVMFIRNDSEGEYYNGMLGKVLSIYPNGTVQVECADSGQSVWVSPVEWDNIQYVLDDAGEIVPPVVGKFRQLPLRVAWAITIHKSQGLTFDKVIIDASAAFAFGQVYVALSRCRSLEGISLEAPLRMSGICSDGYVAAFNASLPSLETVSSRISVEESGYRYDVLCELFDLVETVRLAAKYRKLWAGMLEKLYEVEYRGMIERVDKLDDARGVAAKFIGQLRHIQQSQMPDDSYLNERLQKAAGYFAPVLNDVREYFAACSGVELDNKELKTKLKDAYEQLAVCLDIKCGGIGLINDGKFSLNAYSRVKTDSFLEDRKKSVAKKLVALSEPTSVNEDLRERLQQWRMDRFKKDNIPAYMIMHQSTLLAIASHIPQTKKELLSIKGFGEASFKKYGEEILEITSEYSKK